MSIIISDCETIEFLAMVLSPLILTARTF